MVTISELNNLPCIECITRATCQNKIHVYCDILYNFLISNDYIMTDTLAMPARTVILKHATEKLQTIIPKVAGVYSSKTPERERKK